MGCPLIAGVVLKEILSVPCKDRVITEVYRRDWFDSEVQVGQVFQSLVYPGAVLAWHAHERTTDRLFVSQGMLKAVLFDSRRDSRTFGLVNEICMSISRPRLLVVPPRVWHGIQNTSREFVTLLNSPDQPYCYKDPDHWRLPPDSNQIPYTFAP